ncbi:helix-turn-helix domain-containing protein [Patescibacteria group bacterium]|nr:helix-turn-helix domain-containing protein [Patescibacteria group bacterium]
MAHSTEVKSKAIELREAGYSIKEIAKILNVAVSTSSVWLREVTISREGKHRM